MKAPSGSESPEFDQIAQQFLERLRDGEHPSLAEYKTAYPHLSREIDELFPMLCELEHHLEASFPTLEPMQGESIPRKLGKYEIVREIGRGGMGVVYEARHEVMQRRVALKVLPHSFGQRQPFLDRFMREARSAGKLHHTNIVPVFEIGNDNGTYFYAMQYIHGQNLDVVIDELRRLSLDALGQESDGPPMLKTDIRTDLAVTLLRDGTLADMAADSDRSASVALTPVAAGSVPEPPDRLKLNESSEWSRVGESRDSYFRRVARVGIQIAEALAFAHEHGLLHRDIKPSNLILDTNGVVWITDFGLAKVDGDHLTHTGDIVGTLRYMAPERFQGRADGRSDLYSLGLTLYELCTLKFAFDAPDRAALMQQVIHQAPTSLRRVRPEIPRDLETVIVKAMARDPDSRYQDAGQMAADLRRFVTGKPVLARRASIPERVWRWSKRHPSYAALICSLVLLGATIVAGSLYFGYNEQQHARSLGVEIEKARAAEKEARRASDAAKAHLFWQYYRSGQALRTRGTDGQRRESLHALQQAYHTLPTLLDAGLSEAGKQTRELAVRAQAIAALALWDLTEEKNIPARPGGTDSIATSFAANRYSRVSQSGQVRILDLDTDQELATFRAPNQQRAWATRFSPDGRYFAAVHHAEFQNHEAVIYVWDVSQRRCLLQLDQNLAGGQFAFSSDSSRLAVAEHRGIAFYSLVDGARNSQGGSGS